MKGKEKLIASILAVLVTILGALGFMSSDSFKNEFCGVNPAPSPSPVEVIIQQAK